MPTFETEIETDEPGKQTITIDFEVWCAECGAGLCPSSSVDKPRLGYRNQGNHVRVEPCKKCKDAYEHIARDEGYEQGDGDGYMRGVNETENKLTRKIQNLEDQVDELQRQLSRVQTIQTPPQS